MTVSHSPYRTFYPSCTIRKQQFRVEYRQISRRFYLYRNGKLMGQYAHSDFALLAIVQFFTGFKGDELPFKYQGLMKKIEKGLQLPYQGLIDD